MSETEEFQEYVTILFDIVEFLTEYEKLPCLWDRDHYQFKDRKERLRCEEILGRKLGIHDLRTLRRKIRSVRGTYNTEIRKLKSCIENGSEVCPPRLFWFPTADKFLRVTTDLPYDVFPLCTENNSVRKKQPLEKLPRKKGVKCLLMLTPSKQRKLEDQTDIEEYIDQEDNCEEASESFEEYEELESIENEEQKSQDSNLSPNFETIDDIDQFDSNESASFISKVSADASLISKVKTQSQNQDLTDVVNYLKDISSDNEFMTFGRSVGIQLKNMPLDLAVQLQSDIQAHISKTRLDYLQAKNQIKNESGRK